MDLDTLFSGIAAVGAVATAIGVALAFWQLRQTKGLARTSFEDDLVTAYRGLYQRFPPDAFDEKAPTEVLPEHQLAFFMYFDLSNYQLFLAGEGRVSDAVRTQWEDGIRGNLKLPRFKAAWRDVRDQSAVDSLTDLRDLTETMYPEEAKQRRKRIEALEGPAGDADSAS